MKIIELNIDSILALCKRFKVKSLAVFGSVLTDRFTDSSDVDFLADFNHEIDHTNYADNFFALYHALRGLLKREID